MKTSLLLPGTARLDLWSRSPCRRGAWRGLAATGPRAAPFVALCALLCLVAGVSAAELDPSVAPPTFAGSWTWKFTMPDGTAVRPKVRLMQTGEVFTGTSSLRPGTEAPVTNVVVRDNSIAFEVVRRQHGDTVITRYTGTRNGNVIKGEMESNWAGEKRSYPWEARRAAGIDGTWKWTVQFGGRKFESRVTLKMEGDKLTGSMPGRDGRLTPIKHGSFKDGMVAFEVDRGRDDTRFVTKFEGKLEGEILKGTTETTFGDGEPRVDDWEPTRSE